MFPQNHTGNGSNTNILIKEGVGTKDLTLCQFDANY